MGDQSTQPKTNPFNPFNYLLFVKNEINDEKMQKEIVLRCIKSFETRHVRKFKD